MVGNASIAKVTPDYSQLHANVLVVGHGNSVNEVMETLSEKETISSLRFLKKQNQKRSIHTRAKKFTPRDIDDVNFVVVVNDDVHAVFSVTDNKKAVANQVEFILRSSRSDEYKWKRIASWLVIAFALMITGHVIISNLPMPSFAVIADTFKPYFNTTFILFILTGIVAQLVDGTLGMGYGVTSATCLMSFGISPVSVSAAIHTSEIFTSGVSGYSHYRFGNVNKKLFRHLVIPGVIGAVLGALFLVFLDERAGRWLLPLMALYAMFLGVKILLKAFSMGRANKKVKRVGWLASIGGFLDSFGGGGWGPIVTSTLIAKGKSPKYTIGSVGLTEFFITLASAITFFVSAGIDHWNVVLGLLIGGAIAAPFAAKLAGKLPRKTMMILVGIMVIIWCMRMIARSTGIL